MGGVGGDNDSWKGNKTKNVYTTTRFPPYVYVPLWEQVEAIV